MCVSERLNIKVCEWRSRGGGNKNKRSRMDGATERPKKIWSFQDCCWSGGGGAGVQGVGLYILIDRTAPSSPSSSSPPPPFQNKRVYFKKSLKHGLMRRETVLIIISVVDTNSPPTHTTEAVCCSFQRFLLLLCFFFIVCVKQNLLKCCFWPQKGE